MHKLVQMTLKIYLSNFLYQFCIDTIISNLEHGRYQILIFKNRIDQVSYKVPGQGQTKTSFNILCLTECVRI